MCVRFTLDLPNTYKIMKEKQTHGGKGDLARKVNKAKFDENYDRIFGKKNTTAPLVAENTRGVAESPEPPQKQ